jgi:hypothetical protein
LQKGLDVTASKALDSPNRMTRQLAPPHHPVDGHRRQLQQFSELSDSVKFRLGVISQLRSWHLFPHPINLAAILCEYSTFVKPLLG